MPARFILLEPEPFDPRLPSFLIHGETCIVGRAKDCTFIIDDPIISQHHAKIIWSREDQAYWLVDLNSANGTLHNETRVARAKLALNDTLMFGTRGFRVRSWKREDSPDQTQPLPAASRPPRRPPKWLLPAAVYFFALVLSVVILKPALFPDDSKKTDQNKNEQKETDQETDTPSPKPGGWEYVADPETIQTLEGLNSPKERVAYLEQQLAESLHKYSHPTREEAEGCYKQAMLCRELLQYDLPLEKKAAIVWIHNDRCKLFEAAIESLTGKWNDATTSSDKIKLGNKVGYILPDYVWSPQEPASAKEYSASEPKPRDSYEYPRTHRENIECLKRLSEILDRKPPSEAKDNAP